jgi:hypothetical protein
MGGKGCHSFARAFFPYKTGWRSFANLPNPDKTG